MDRNIISLTKAIEKCVENDGFRVSVVCHNRVRAEVLFDSVLLLLGETMRKQFSYEKNNRKIRFNNGSTISFDVPTEFNFDQLYRGIELHDVVDCIPDYLSSSYYTYLAKRRVRDYK